MLSSLGNNRVARFIWLAGKEFIPEPVKLPVSLARHFRDCFFVTSPQERLELYAQLAAADEKATREIEEMIRKEWENILPAGRKLPVGTTAVVRGLVESLRAAGKEKNASDDAQLSSLEGVLGAQVLAGGDALPPASLNPQQVQLGRLVVSSALRAAPDIGTGLPAFPQIPGYQIKRFLKQGGFGQVYVAYHEASDTLRAVKVGDAAEHKRLDRELKLAREFDSPHLVKYLDHGKLDGRYWIAMDYLSEQSLGEMLETAGGKFDPELALLIGEQVLTGLSVLHANNVIHRDLTPNNVMADASFRLRLIDFGLARPIGGIGVGTGTTTGSIVGTPFYMSPEQLFGDELTLASDVYSFGVLMYRLLTGTEPFRAANIAKLAVAVENGNPDVNRDGIPQALREFIGKCLAKEPEKRFPDARTAFQVFSNIGPSITWRLRRDRFALAWNQARERQAIEKFVVQYHGDGEPNAVARAFSRWMADQKLTPLDEEWMARLFPPIFDAARAVIRAATLLLHVKQTQRALEQEAPEQERELWRRVIDARNVAFKRAHIVRLTSREQAILEEITNPGREDSAADHRAARVRASEYEVEMTYAADSRESPQDVVSLRLDGFASLPEFMPSLRKKIAKWGWRDGPHAQPDSLSEPPPSVPPPAPRAVPSPLPETSWANDGKKREPVNLIPILSFIALLVVFLALLVAVLRRLGAI
jgi:hypothetical protein